MTFLFYNTMAEHSSAFLSNSGKIGEKTNYFVNKDWDGNSF